MKIDVVGGTYREQCLEPSWDAYYGSGGRAASALSSVSDVVFHTYLNEGIDAFEWKWPRKLQLKAYGDNDHIPLRFEYDHPLSTPKITPHPRDVKKQAAIDVVGDVVLRFGMLEGTAKITASKAVYDPQSAFEPEPFHANGSTADQLAYVINMYEAKKMTGEESVEAISSRLLNEFGASVAVVKCGSKGAFVCVPGKIDKVPSYKSASVWKVGTGDVFSAAFTYYWAVEGGEPLVAAEAASKVTSLYVDTKSATVPPMEFLSAIPFEEVASSSGRVYLAGPFFDLGQRWVIEEAYSVFKSFGADTFSPLHDVGKGAAHEVAKADLEGLKQCDRVFAVLSGLDPGTIYEIGYARALGLPVIVLAQNVAAEDLKMPAGDGCIITEDFCTAIYKTMWI